MRKTDKIKRIIELLNAILDRYEKYGKYLNYPGDWGERAFRGWVVFEIFHDCFGWPVENIVFGEKFDVLLIDNDIKPVIYIETKKPHRGLADIRAFKLRIENYATLEIAVLVNGYEWLSFNVITKKQEKININDDLSKWKIFLRPLFASNFLYGVES